MKIVVEAKYWNRLSSKKPDESKNNKKRNDSASGLGPELQTLSYMSLFDLDFGILTDGKKWRLFQKDLSQGIDRRSFDFDLGRMKNLVFKLDIGNNEQKLRHYLKYFYCFFSKQTIIAKSNKKKSLVQKVFDHSQKYATNIEEDLKERFITTMSLMCNSIRKSCEKLNEDINLETIRNVSEGHLFNLLFIKSCEVRRILPVVSTQYVRHSLHEVIETMDAIDFDPSRDWDDYIIDFKRTFGKKFDWDGTELFKRIVNLYEIVHDGSAKSKDFGFEVEGFKESTFDKDQWRFVKNHPITNKEVIEILHNMNFTTSEHKERIFQQIPYSYFTPRQLGGIYESFLEYKLQVAQFDMIFHEQQWQKANLRSETVKKLNLSDSCIVEKDDLYFSPNNKERKMTGSYYTPDDIVREIVSESLGEITKKKKADDLFELNICDPAMGSGHFLAGALDFLVDTYKTKWSYENNDDFSMDEQELTREFLKTCLYGVDRNERAVKLSRLSMWLMTAQKGRKLENLTKRFKVGDSLIDTDFKKDYPKKFNWKKEFPTVFKKGGFDSVIGNPPYLLVGSDQPDEQEYFSDKEKYPLNNYKINTYMLFINRGMDILNNNGSLGYIVPKSLVFNSYFKKSRKMLLETFGMYLITEIDGKVFEDAEVGDSILVYNNKGNKKSRKFTYEKVKYNEKLTKISCNSRKVEEILEEAGDYQLTGVKTNLDDNFINLIEVADIFNGLNPGNVKHKLIHDEKINSKCKKMVLGKDIQRYSLGWSGSWVLFDPSLKNKLTVKDIKSKKGMTAQKKVDFALRKEKIYLGPKVLVRKTADHIVACYDDKDHYYDSLAYGILPKEGSSYSPYYFLALLNSSVVNQIHDGFSNNKKKVFAKVLASNLKKLPIYKIDFSNEDQVKIHNKLVELAKQITTNPVLSKVLIQEIDEIVTSLYGAEALDQAA